MSQIFISNLTFAYDSSFDNVFENTSFSIDTDWKLGFIGRNGKGKTTLLRLLMGEYEYSGSISASVRFDYFPYAVADDSQNAAELMETWKPGVELWRVLCELNGLEASSELLFRPFSTLSFGERTKVMLSVLFSGENDFLLIDEPTNHLDAAARETIKKYLAAKKGFILVSHDRGLLDACADHVLVLNRSSIEVQAGNFSSWWANKENADKNARSENEKHLKEIDKLKAAADRSSRWADKSESSKIGFDPIKESDRNISTRSYLGGKTKKMEKRVKAYENRINREIEEKEGLLNDLEQVYDLKLAPLVHHKNRLVACKDFSLTYKDSVTPAVSGLTFELLTGSRLFLSGQNGCGKSSIIKAILAVAAGTPEDDLPFTISGTLRVASGLQISYINQDTTHLNGYLKDYALEKHLDYTLFLSLLRQLDFERVQFDKRMESYSEGQKKKVLIAASLLTPAHLYIWDEPLNYIDVFSRMQIEKLIREYQPTMLLVEHDARFRELIATEIIEL